MRTGVDRQVISLELKDIHDFELLDPKHYAMGKLHQSAIEGSGELRDGDMIAYGESPHDALLLFGVEYHEADQSYSFKAVKTNPEIGIGQDLG